MIILNYTFFQGDTWILSTPMTVDTVGYTGYCTAKQNNAVFVANVVIGTNVVATFTNTTLAKKGKFIYDIEIDGIDTRTLQRGEIIVL